MMGLTEFNLTPKAKKGLKDAQKFAEANSHSLITNAHLIYGCLANISDSCSLKLKTHGVALDLKSFIKYFKKYASDNPKVFEPVKGDGGWHGEVNEAVFLAKEFSDNFDSYFIGVEHIFYVVLDMGGPFIEFLMTSGLDVYHAKDVIEGHILEGSIPSIDGLKNLLNACAEQSIEGKKQTRSMQDNPQATPIDHLRKYSTNLTQQFLLKKGSEISGRDGEIKELIEILSKKNKSNAILVGEAGVGKTAIVEGLAQQIVRQEVPAHMSLMQICAVDISGMVAGTKYRGGIRRAIQIFNCRGRTGTKYYFIF